ncbi:MAG: N-acetylglucosaminyl-diphospho-decaprenol L-rhamnosyltransferase [Pelotomaculum sp. PtaB.Bin104]|nr:MAG: N-acetylglucosaminyl-diphospho-decaprenol L-rhamnosyltransferase [Pelotomaculum sp. PtaB.Bin104]
MDLSVIIVNWNTRDILRDCLKSVYEQTTDIVFEVIVIDNASSDGSREMVRAEFPQVILIENTQNRGFAAANNQGMRICRGRYVLLLNSDTVVLDKAIQKVMSFADKHPEASVIGCKVLNPDKTLQPTCFMFPSLLNLLLSTTYLYKLFPCSRFFGREQMSWWDRNDVRQVDVVTGCFMLVRREAIEQVGLMDEDYFMYAEETDWCWRFKRAGWNNLFYPDSQIIHLGGQSSKQVRVAMIVQLRRAILQFIRKNYGALQYYLGSILVLIFYMVRIPYWLFLAVLTKERRRAVDMAIAYWRGCCSIITGK